LKWKADQPACRELEVSCGGIPLSHGLTLIEGVSRFGIPKLDLVLNSVMLLTLSIACPAAIGGKIEGVVIGWTE